MRVSVQGRTHACRCISCTAARALAAAACMHPRLHPSAPSAARSCACGPSTPRPPRSPPRRCHTAACSRAQHTGMHAAAAWSGSSAVSCVHEQQGAGVHAGAASTASPSQHARAARASRHPAGWAATPGPQSQRRPRAQHCRQARSSMQTGRRPRATVSASRMQLHAAMLARHWRTHPCSGVAARLSSLIGDARPVCGTTFSVASRSCCSGSAPLSASASDTRQQMRRRAARLAAWGRTAAAAAAAGRRRAPTLDAADVGERSDSIVRLVVLEQDTLLMWAESVRHRPYQQHAVEVICRRWELRLG